MKLVGFALNLEHFHTGVGFKREQYLGKTSTQSVYTESMPLLLHTLFFSCLTLHPHTLHCGTNNNIFIFREARFHILITSYQLIIADEKYLRRLKWQYMVLDEAQAIKSSQR